MALLFVLGITFLGFMPAGVAGIVTVDHALGVATLETQPERVVSLYQGATDTAVALGIKPVGMVESWTEKPMYQYLRAYLSDVRMLGLETQPDLEGIALLDPDLIVAARNRHLAIFPLLDQIAPTVVIDDVYEFKPLLSLMAKATGKKEQGLCLLEHWQARTLDFQSRIRKKLGSAWPTEVAILSFRADHARIYYGGFARSVLEELGFLAPAPHRQKGWGIKLTSEESIPAMDAETIFLFMEDDPAVQRTYRRWSAHPLWQNLKAVQAGEVYPVDPITWNMGAGILAANLMLDDLYRHYRLRDPLPEVLDAC
ncbi:iron ABC transporter substrate-binding protein [Marinobacter sp. EhC06]|jgi:iron complex transport system substrate-binding protein|nr:iron-siderophore ABC transporter substrate-binding protein [Marinobacter sp. MC3]MBL3891693.1 iron-siderophore ABC transporter substrate-binding protein [Marinobacter sp. MW3]OAN88452.1 iron ABC transporter substrate-binding protein [Marinobacter sp. EhN04]OAN91434.1 iron ABC transporter substrate-binding protein [Marinobacter sp. EhC06]